MSYPIEFTTTIPYLIIEGEFDLFSIHSKNSCAIFASNEELKICLKWKMNSIITSLITGYWIIRLFLEIFGADDLCYPPKKIYIRQKQFEYSSEFNIGANVLSPGLYKVTTSVVAYTSKGIETHIDGYGESHLIQVYDPKSV